LHLQTVDDCVGNYLKNYATHNRLIQTQTEHIFAHTHTHTHKHTKCLAVVTLQSSPYYYELQLAPIFWVLCKQQNFGTRVCERLKKFEQANKCL